MKNIINDFSTIRSKFMDLETFDLLTISNNGGPPAFITTTSIKTIQIHTI